MAFLIKFSAASWKPCIDKNVLCTKISCDDRFTGTDNYFVSNSVTARPGMDSRSVPMSKFIIAINWANLAFSGWNHIARPKYWYRINRTIDRRCITQSQSNTSAINWAVRAGVVWALTKYLLLVIVLIWSGPKFKMLLQVLAFWHTNHYK